MPIDFFALKKKLPVYLAGSFFFICILFHSQSILSYNPWDLSLNERIINRKNVSHIIIETGQGAYKVTLMLSDRYPYNYKSRSYPFYIAADSEKKAVELAKNIDKILDSGVNIYIRLKGSEIIHYSIYAESD